MNQLPGQKQIAEEVVRMIAKSHLLHQYMPAYWLFNCCDPEVAFAIDLSDFVVAPVGAAFVVSVRVSSA